MSFKVILGTGNDDESSQDVRWDSLESRFPVGTMGDILDAHNILVGRSVNHNVVLDETGSVIIDIAKHIIPFSLDVPHFESNTMKVRSHNVLTPGKNGQYNLAEIENEMWSERSGIQIHRHERAVFQGDDLGFYTEFELTFKDEQQKDVTVRVVQCNTPFQGLLQSLEIVHNGNTVNVDLTNEVFKPKSSYHLFVNDENRDEYGILIDIKRRDFPELGMYKAEGNTGVAFDPYTGDLSLFIEGKYSLSLKSKVPFLIKDNIPVADYFIATVASTGIFPMFYSGITDLGTYQEMISSGSTSQGRFAQLGSPISAYRQN